MFNNLIESSSHGRELRRRGSFMLFTTASYALLFAIVGVISIYAYDAQMKDQDLQIVTLLPPVVEAPREPETPGERPNNPGNHRPQAFDERRVFVAPIDRVERPPDSISTNPNPFPPVRDNVLTVASDRDVNAESPGSSGNRESGTTGSRTDSNRIIMDTEPPPAPTPKPAPPKVVRKQIINSEAISLPKPIYPPIAKQTGTQGPVNVQVLIDESGKVISAKVISGNPLLTHAAVNAAYQARFSPTMLGDQPVKVSGVITYNFILQR